jgi:UDPglucose 6-dehydrogenase
VLIEELSRRGATVAACDRLAMDEAWRVFGDRAGLGYAAMAPVALCGADALLIVTEWKEFRTPDLENIRSSLKQPLDILYGRNLYNPSFVAQMGIECHGIGRGNPPLK